MRETNRRLTIYILQSSLSYALGGLTVIMFGEGHVSRPKMIFMWTVFLIGLALNVVNTIRTYMDKNYEPGSAAAQSLSATPPLTFSGSVNVSTQGAAIPAASSSSSSILS